MTNRFTLQSIAAVVALLSCLPLMAEETERWDGSIVQFGKMHDAIGQRHDEGRVRLSKLVERPHFSGVAALAGLTGEATILDGDVLVTRVDEEGRLQASDRRTPAEQATLLVGAYVPAWTEHQVAADVSPDEFDQCLADLAAQAGIDVDKPFVFTVEGDLVDLHMHVINGACPLHARLRKIELPKEKRPFEGQLAETPGTIVGVFARDSVGNITHPATSTHAHVVLKDAETGQTITGHIEQTGLRKGAVVRLPK